MAYRLQRSEPVIQGVKRIAREQLENALTDIQTESIDRMYLNVYQPSLQIEQGAAVFFRRHRGEVFATAHVMAKMTRVFITNIERFVDQHGLPLVKFEKGLRKEDVFHEHLANFDRPEGIVFVGKAQEKATVFRTVKRRCPQTGRTFP